MMGFTLPYRFGGLNCPTLVYTMANEMVSRAEASLMNLFGLQDIAETINKYGDEAQKQEFKEAWDAAGVTCILQNAGQEGNRIDVLMKRLARFNYAADLLRDFSPRAVCPDDIVQAHEEGRHCFYMTANGVPLMNDWVDIEDELRYIRIFFQLGIRMMHITYNRANMIGFGCGEANDAGLTDFGRRVVAEMNRQGVSVDVAHSGHQTSLEAARVSEKPMVASHTVAHALNGHYRGKPDHVMKAIADTGGLIGVCCIQRFLGRSMDLAAFLDHIDHMAKVVGTDHIAIGTDVAYSPMAYDGLWEKLPKPAKAREPWRSLWPDPGVPDPDPDDRRASLSLSWTNWPMRRPFWRPSRRPGGGRWSWRASQPTTRPRAWSCFWLRSRRSGLWPGLCWAWRHCEWSGDFVHSVASESPRNRNS